MEEIKSNIKKVVFEVDYYDSNSVSSMQNKIISEYNLNISEKIEELFIKYTTGYFIKKDLLKLDLGVISKESCEKDLTRLIEDKLKSYLINLQRKLEVNDIPSDIEVISFNESLHQYLLNYFKYGKVNWNHESFSFENDIGYWLQQLSILSPSLFCNISELFRSKDARIRFFNSIPIRNGKTPFYELFPIQIKDKLAAAEKLLGKILELSGHPEKHRILVDYLLYISSEISVDEIVVDTQYVSKSFYDYILIEKDISNSNLFMNLSRIDEDWLEFEQKIIINEIFRRFSSVATKSYDVSIEIPLEVAESYNTWDTYRQILNKRVPAWTNVILDTTHNLILSIEKKINKTDNDYVEKMIRKLVIETITVSEFPDNIEMWMNIVTEQITKVFGYDLQDEIHEIILSSIGKKRKSKSLQKKKVLKKISFQDGNSQFQINLDTALRYLRYFSKIGISGLNNYFKEPISVLEQILLVLKSSYPRYYNTELNKVAKSLIVADIHLISESSMEPGLKKEIVNTSGLRSILYELEGNKDEIGGLFLVDILRGKIIPANILTEYGFNKLAFQIRIFIKHNKVSLEKIIQDLSISYDKTQLEYLERITDQQSFKIITELLNLSTTVEKEIGTEPEIDLIVKFQMGIELFFSGTMTNDQLVEFEMLMKKLIDLRSDEFAKFIIVQPDQEIRKIKNILPEKYKSKIDTMLFSVKENLEIHQEELKSEQVAYIEEGEELYIRNSGLIILNPYLNTLFTRLGYVENKKFLSDNHRNKAIRVMHYLVTGTTEWEEPDIVLNKILAGIEPFDVVKNNINEDLTPEEKKTCEGLLEAVIKNWGALKNTSIDSLRGSFLIRNGKLSFEQSSWRLAVERKAFDVLLDKIPWSFSTIKLPWMTNPLITEW